MCRDLTSHGARLPPWRGQDPPRHQGGERAFERLCRGSSRRLRRRRPDDPHPRRKQAQDFHRHSVLDGARGDSNPPTRDTMPRRTYGASASLPWRWPQARPPTANCTPCVSFFIPKNPPPRLEGDFSPEFKEFVARCLQKDGGRRHAPGTSSTRRSSRARAETSPALMRRVAERMGAAADATTATVSSDGGEADAAPTPPSRPRGISATGPSREGSTDPPEAARKTPSNARATRTTRSAPRRRRRRRRDRNRTGTRNRGPEPAAGPRPSIRRAGDCAGARTRGSRRRAIVVGGGGCGGASDARAGVARVGVSGIVRGVFSRRGGTVGERAAEREPRCAPRRRTRGARGAERRGTTGASRRARERRRSERVGRFSPREVAEISSRRRLSTDERLTAFAATRGKIAYSRRKIFAHTGSLTTAVAERRRSILVECPASADVVRAGVVRVVAKGSLSRASRVFSLQILGLGVWDAVHCEDFPLSP